MCERIGEKVMSLYFKKSAKLLREGISAKPLTHWEGQDSHLDTVGRAGTGRKGLQLQHHSQGVQDHQPPPEGSVIRIILNFCQHSQELGCRSWKQIRTVKSRCFCTSWILIHYQGVQIRIRLLVWISILHHVSGLDPDSTPDRWFLWKKCLNNAYRKNKD